MAFSRICASSRPFLLLFFRDAGLSFFQIGVLYAVRDISTNFLEVPAGVIADAFGRRKSMVLSFSSYIVSFVIFYALPGFATFILAMIIFGVGEAFRSGTHKALILEHLHLTDKEHLKVPYYGRTRGASQLGSALNALVAAGLVFFTGDYRYVFPASILPYVIDLVNLATYPPELDGDLEAFAWQKVPEQIKATGRTFLGIFRNPRALRAIFNSSGFDAYYKATKGLSPAHPGDLRAGSTHLRGAGSGPALLDGHRRRLLRYLSPQQLRLAEGGCGERILWRRRTGHQSHLLYRRRFPLCGGVCFLAGYTGVLYPRLPGTLSLAQRPQAAQRRLYQRSDRERGDGIGAVGRIAAGHAAGHRHRAGAGGRWRTRWASAVRWRCWAFRCWCWRR